MVTSAKKYALQVEWAEINAAWGQTLLLLYTIARKLDFTFEKYVIHVYSGIHIY